MPRRLDAETVEDPRTVEANETEESPTVDTNALIAKLMGMIEDVRSDNKTLRAELDRRAPSFRPMQRARGSGSGSISDVLANMERGDERMGNSTIPVGVNGRVLDKNILAFLSPRFKVGDYIRINPDSTRPGGTHTWESILKGRDGIGEVTKVEYLGRNMEWKYRCRISGITGAKGDGFSDSELEPAYESA